jgi:hypothetical protein
VDINSDLKAQRDFDNRILKMEEIISTCQQVKIGEELYISCSPPGGSQHLGQGSVARSCQRRGIDPGKRFESILNRSQKVLWRPKNHSNGAIPH